MQHMQTGVSGALMSSCTHSNIIIKYNRSNHYYANPTHHATLQRFFIDVFKENKNTAAMCSYF